MYWLIALTWGLIGTIIFWSHLSQQWLKIDSLERLAVCTLSFFHSVPADADTGYLPLQFSILRHAFVFLISSILIYFVKTDFILTIILLINLLYCWLPISRYRNRKKDIAETASRPNGQATAQMLSIFVKDSFCTIIHSVGCAIILYVLYAIRP